ncbi:MAG: hypothetical protein QXW47_02195 [Candidatus Jordarchaeales archaeon]
MVEEGSEDAKKKAAYYEDTAKILLEEGIHDVAVDFYTLAGMYSLLAGDEDGRKYIEKAVEICKNYGVSGHREVFASIGVRIFEGKYEGIEEEWSEIRGEYSEEEDQLVRELLEKLKRRSVEVEQVVVQEAEEWEIAEGGEGQFEGQSSEQATEGILLGEGARVEEVKTEEERVEVAVIDPRNVYGRIKISEIAWRAGENTERVRQVLSTLIQSGRIPGKIEGNEYIQDEGIICQTIQAISKPQRTNEKTGFLSALKERDVAAPTKPGYKRCGVCGEEIPEAFMVCTYCGARQ